MNEFAISFVLDPRLHAHAKSGWRAKADPVKEARKLGRLLAFNAKAKLTGRVEVSYSFFVGDRRRRDEANMIHHCKPIIDGVVDAGAIPGDHWEVLGIGRVSTTLDCKLDWSRGVQVVLHFSEVGQ